MTESERERIRALRYEDGLTSEEVARRFGVHGATVRRIAPGYPGKIPVAPLRALFLASGRTPTEVARRLGWLCRGKGDTSRVQRALGLRDEVSGKGLRSRRRMIDAETAGDIAEALGYERWEAEE